MKLKKLFFKSEQGFVVNPVNVKYAVQVIKFVLKHRSKEAVRFKTGRITMTVGKGHAYVLGPFDKSPQAWNREAALPVAG